MRVCSWAIVTSVLFFLACDDNKGTVEPPDYVFPIVWDTPAWSPDGKTIAAYYTGIYQIDPKTGGYSVDLAKQGLWLMDADGSNMRMKFNGPILTPSWHPNGESLVFSMVPYGGAMFKADTTMDSLIQLTDVDGYFHARWSSDGRRILCHRVFSPGGIILMSTDGQHKKFLADALFPCWSPDLTRIACAGFGGIAAIDSNGENADLLSEGYSPDRIDWALDGNDIYFSSKETMYRFSIDNGNVYPIAPNASYPSISPDGSKIVYLNHTWASYSPENGHLFIMNADGSNKQQITFTEGGDSLR